ncbi:ABC-F family ATP-binding cassette domain-containing protein [Nemorincola caseinilytica]|uniref:ABC-F family ATP-binding cassette domain-containing protein n=1 Tax=Nemorincola caseinilytica TaxID=2054315 RepID=A0ABP8NFK3_9BACT
MIAGQLRPATGRLAVQAQPYYVPQVSGSFDHMTVAQALHVADKLHALQKILGGDMNDTHLATLNDDWNIEERCHEALAQWQLHDVGPGRNMGTLSGGQKMKVLLAGIYIHRPRLILLDEPSNHMDTGSRQILYAMVRDLNATMIVVSHDRQLLELLPTICELGRNGITTYGGGYAFYRTQKEIALSALGDDIKSKEKELRKAREKERETAERQQKLDARGRKKQEKAGTPTIMLNTLRNNAEKSTSKLRDVHAEKIGGIANDLRQLRAALPELDKMKMAFANAALHKGKVLFSAQGMNHSYTGKPLWKKDLDIVVTSGERISLKGDNGTGKTSLIKMMLGELAPMKGAVTRAEHTTAYIDQDTSLLNDGLSVFEQVRTYNRMALQEHEIGIWLGRFLFGYDEWGKPCAALSGGERMRLVLCCLSVAEQAPDMMILDEPTNNLDMQNVDILTAAISAYRGTLIVVSHDAWFLQQLGVEREILLE